MAYLRHLKSNRIEYLLSHHTFGRRQDVVDTHLEQPDISKLHAVIEWTASGWSLRDLSRNGTWIEESRVEKRQTVNLSLGQTITFAKDVWKIENLKPPSDLFINVTDPKRSIELEQCSMLPTEEQPEYFVFFDTERASWSAQKVDQNYSEIESVRSLRHGEIIEFNGEKWKVFLPPKTNLTEDVIQANLSLSHFHFEFSVSQNEEDISLTIKDQAHVWNLENRAHFYLLLYLSRKRISDHTAGVASSEQGWVDNSLMSKELGLDESHVNIQIFRNRQQISKTLSEVPEASQVIQRRRGSSRINLGIDNLSIKSR